MKRHKKSLSHYRIATGDMAEILPIDLVEVHPGDSFQGSSSVMLRVSPLNAPVMHPVRVKIEHWFVPHRLVWEDFEDFITGGEDGLNASVFPTIEFDNATSAAGTLPDYLGVPVMPAGGGFVSALPFRGYAKIYNEFKRNTLLQTAIGLSVASGVDTTTSISLLKANWMKDRLTSASPEPQLGPDVTVNLGGDANIIVNPTTGVQSKVLLASDHTEPAANAALSSQNGTPGGMMRPGAPVIYDPNGTLLADLSAATGITIRELRESTALQRYFENRMMNGSRYSDLLRSLGVRYSDARLQRPELLGSSMSTIQFSEVLQTGVTTDSDPDGVGNLKGHGIATAKSNRYRKSFEEHGYVFTLLTVLPTTMYAQGIPRTYNRRVKTDFFTPEFAHVGQQEILNKEVYADAAAPEGVFGYEDRYREYSEQLSTVHGEFKSTLDFWHYARLFGSEPALNASFVAADPTKRVNQVTSADVLWIFAHHSLQARRIMGDSRPGGSL